MLTAQEVLAQGTETGRPYIWKDQIACLQVSWRNRLRASLLRPSGFLKILHSNQGNIALAVSAKGA